MTKRNQATCTPGAEDWEYIRFVQEEYNLRDDAAGLYYLMREGIKSLKGKGIVPTQSREIAEA